jgi:hypothetical protein
MPPDKRSVTFGLSVGYEFGAWREGRELSIGMDSVSRKEDRWAALLVNFDLAGFDNP